VGPRDGRAGREEPGHLGVHLLLAHLAGHVALAADAEVEVEPVLDRLGLGHLLEPDPRAHAVGIDDAVGLVGPDQFLFGHADAAVVREPAGLAVGRVFELVVHGRGPEAGLRHRVGAVDHEL
jgi:hypothetical protein